MQPAYDPAMFANLQIQMPTGVAPVSSFDMSSLMALFQNPQATGGAQNATQPQQGYSTSSQSVYMSLPVNNAQPALATQQSSQPVAMPITVTPTATPATPASVASTPSPVLTSTSSVYMAFPPAKSDAAPSTTTQAAAPTTTPVAMPATTQAAMPTSTQGAVPTTQSNPNFMLSLASLGITGNTPAAKPAFDTSNLSPDQIEAMKKLGLLPADTPTPSATSQNASTGSPSANNSNPLSPGGSDSVYISFTGKPQNRLSMAPQPQQQQSAYMAFPTSVDSRSSSPVLTRNSLSGGDSSATTAMPASPATTPASPATTSASAATTPASPATTSASPATTPSESPKSVASESQAKTPESSPLDLGELDDILGELSSDSDSEGPGDENTAQPTPSSPDQTNKSSAPETPSRGSADLSKPSLQSTEDLIGSLVNQLQTEIVKPQQAASEANNSAAPAPSASTPAPAPAAQTSEGSSVRPISMLIPGGSSMPPQKALEALQQQFAEFQANFAANPSSLTPEQFQAKMQMFQQQLLELQKQLLASAASPQATPGGTAAQGGAPAEHRMSAPAAIKKEKKKKETNYYKSGPLLKLGGKKPFKKWQLRKCTITKDRGMEWHAIDEKGGVAVFKGRINLTKCTYTDVNSDHPEFQRLRKIPHRHIPKDDPDYMSYFSIYSPDTGKTYFFAVPLKFREQWKTAFHQAHG